MNARAAQKCPAAARSPLWALLATLEKYLAASAYWRLRKAERPATQLAIADHSPPSPAAFCASTSARRSSPALYQAQAIRWVHCVRLSLSSEVRSRRSAASATRLRSEEHTSELQSLMRISYAVFCLKKKTQPPTTHRQSRS